jgi:hypothetical protein
MKRISLVAISTVMLPMLGLLGKDPIYCVIWFLIVIAFLLADLKDGFK